MVSFLHLRIRESLPFYILGDEDLVTTVCGLIVCCSGDNLCSCNLVIKQATVSNDNETYTFQDIIVIPHYIANTY